MATTQTNQHLIRSNLWSNELKTNLEGELFAQKYVKMITDFPDGDTLNIPSIGQGTANDYVENEAVEYTNLDEGNFTFTIDKYKSSAMYITKKHRQDAYYAAQLEAAFVPAQARAIGAAIEANVLAVGPNGQTAANPNVINGGDHRLAGSGTSAAIALADFAKANYALNVANVPIQGRVAIVHPSVEFTLNQLVTVTNATSNMKWANITTDGMMSSLTSLNMNIHGFDVYVSQYLKENSASESITDSGSNTVAVSNGVNNLFFSTAPDAMPLIGAMRQMPEVDSFYNHNRQREEYVTTCRFGHKLYRPEGLVTVVTNKSVVY